MIDAVVGLGAVAVVLEVRVAARPSAPGTPSTASVVSGAGVVPFAPSSSPPPPPPPPVVVVSSAARRVGAGRRRRRRRTRRARARDQRTRLPTRTRRRFLIWFAIACPVTWDGCEERTLTRLRVACRAAEDGAECRPHGHRPAVPARRRAARASTPSSSPSTSTATGSASTAPPSTPPAAASPTTPALLGRRLARSLDVRKEGDARLAHRSARARCRRSATPSTARSTGTAATR